MKKMKKINLILLLIAGLAFNYNSQAQSLGFDTPPMFPTTAALNDTNPVFVNLGIKNYGNAPFTGSNPIYLVTRVTSGGNLISIDSSMNVINQATIQPGSTYNFTYVEPYNSGRYVVGIDVVVIWPKSFGVPTHDSITYVIQITPPASIQEMLAENGIAVYPNPCSNNLNIEYTGLNNPIERVRVFDMKGTLIFSKTRNEVIDFSQIPEATYVVEVSFQSGMRRVMRVQKQ